MCSLALAACASGGQKKGVTTSSGAIEVPVITTLSGEGAANDDGATTAMKIAQDEINKAGGIDGHKLVLKINDDQSDPARGARLMNEFGPSSLIVEGPNLTSVSAAVFPVAKSQQVPVVGLSSDSGVITSGQPWAFSTFAPAQSFMPGLIRQWAEVTGAKNVSLIYDSENAATLAQGQVYEQSLKSDGINYDSVKTQTGMASYQGPAAQVASKHADAVGVCGLVADAASIVHSLRSDGFHGPILLCPATTGPDTVKLLGHSASNVYLATSWFPAEGGSRAVAFTKTFESLDKGQVPGSTATPSWYYDIKLIAQALDKTGVIDSKDSLQAKRQKLQRYLASVNGFPGLTGTFSMNKAGYLEGPSMLLKLEAGEFSVVPK